MSTKLNNEKTLSTTHSFLYDTFKAELEEQGKRIESLREEVEDLLWKHAQLKLAYEEVMLTNSRLKTMLAKSYRTRGTKT